ncbi:MAG: exonuclease SbcCD subunit D [Oscillospiraceae bacterium]|nr:exonuclease SbcCD subunit D [Oscillospiraceae bacterium]
MKFIHLADFHLGRRVSGFSLIEDQTHILGQINRIIDEEKPDFILIAGDVYDKLSPSVEAVSLLDGFLTKLSAEGIRTFIIAGNHDSPERIAFGANLMNQSGVHFSPIYSGKAEKFTVSDTFGEADVYLLPYLRTAEARRFFPDAEIGNTADAVRTAIEAMQIDPSRRNIIISHQFVEGGVTSDSERGAVGGTDGVPAELYRNFEYAALGHLHKPQKMQYENVRYGGTPLKYSISEADDKKCVTVCELGAKGTPVKVTLRELTPLRDMRELTGSFAELIEGGSDDFVQVRLTDTERVPDAQKRLRTVYPHIMSVKYEQELSHTPITIIEDAAVQCADPFELFTAFFEDVNTKKMTDEQCGYMQKLIRQIWE